MITGIQGRSFQLQLPQEVPGLSGQAGVGEKTASGGLAGSGGTGFGQAMKQFLGEVNDLQQRSSATFDAFVRGEVTDLHQVALAQQEAGIALRLVSEMRDRLLQSYQEVMRTTL